MTELEFWDFVDKNRTLILQRFKLMDHLSEENIPKRTTDILEYKGEIYQLTENPICSVEGNACVYKATALKIADNNKYMIKWLAGNTSTNNIFDFPMYKAIRWDRPVKIECISQFSST